MNEHGAALALGRVAERGDADAVRQISDWLGRNVEGIAGRYDREALRAAVEAAAAKLAGGIAAEDAVRELVSKLASATETLIFALFTGATIRQVWDFDPVWLGPADAVSAAFELSHGLHRSGVERLRGDELVVLVTDWAQGRIGAANGLQKLRGALGALQLAARLADPGSDARPMPLMELGCPPTVFTGARRSPEYRRLAYEVPMSAHHELDVDSVLDRSGDLFRECTSGGQGDFIAQRLTQASPWLQVAFDSFTYWDAVLALGIALEALIGSEGSDVVRTVSRRTAFLLRKEGSSDERALDGLAWSRLATKCYAARSSVAHGRYMADAHHTEAEDALRAEFESLVCQVAARFRVEGHDRGWSGAADLKEWELLLEMA